MNMELEQVLVRELGPVTAPRELRDRVQLGRVGQTNDPGRSTRRSLIWAAVGIAAVLMLAAIWNYRSVADAGLETLAASTNPPQFQSTDAGEIRGWVKATAGIDVALRPRPPASVRLVGASVRKDTAEISCRVGDRPAKLVVSKAQAGPFDGARHHVLSSNWFRRGRVLSWIMRGQLYTLACATPGDLKVACFLCHGG